ncbi:glycosyltransferase [Rothia kristinae]|uniref:glycosyltransferase n=1 Tax=Rothia kristinae TaxID=37923 RepID=UPI0022E22132|nr:glycosyltransferase [Rothia kristinae]
MPEKPLRILIGADTYPPDINGAAQFGHRLAVGMRDRGHEVHVVAARTGAGPSYTIDIDGITEHRLRSHHPPTHPYYRLCFPWEMQRRVGRILDEVRPDVVHIQCHYIVGRMLAWAAQRRGIRLVATNHFMPENLNPFLPFPDWFLRGFAKLSWKDMEHVLGRAEVITTPTPIGARSMHEHGFAKPILPVSNGIDSAAYELRPGERVDEPAHPTILFTGRLAVEKNLDVLIRALARLPKELDARLRLAGTGEVEPALREVARAEGVADRVEFLGYVSDEQLRREYLSATVFCQPGTAELQSLVTLEALSASRPVVLADALALPHLVRQGVNGYLFTPQDPEDLAAKLRLVLEATPQERAAMGRAGRELVRQHDVHRTWDLFEALYRGEHLMPETAPDVAG